MYGNGVVGILKEENKWERRAPLTPFHCLELLRRRKQEPTSQGIQKIIIQPCTKRIHQNLSYEEAGCEVSEDMSQCGLILGVKSPKLGTILPQRSYAFFSHTHKGQPHNMGLLGEVLEKDVTLFDYELMATKEGKRVVAFGEFAGRAGMLDFLRGIGERFLNLGFSTPFLGLGFAHMYPSLSKASEAVLALGEEIKHTGLPSAICPLVFVFTACGNVGQGAMEIFKLLPHSFVDAKELPNLVKNTLNAEQSNRFKVFGCLIDASHMVEHNNPNRKDFDKAHYYANPEEYHSVFHTNVAPYTSFIINCMYWEPRFPRLLTNEQLQKLFLIKESDPDFDSRILLLGVADISCDLNGSIECVYVQTSIDKPFFRYNPLTTSYHGNMEGDGIIVLAVDVLPTEFPREATEHFSDAIAPLLEAMTCNLTLQTMPLLIQNACVVSRGRLNPLFDHLIQQQAVAALTLAKVDSDKTNISSPSELVSSTIHVIGNIFDPFLINEMLDIIMENQGDFDLQAIDPNNPPPHGTNTHTFCAQIRITTDNELNMARIRSLLTNHVDPTHEFLRWNYF